MKASQLIRHFGFIILLVVVATSCRRPVSVRTQGDIAFSADTVKFDTLFTQQQSPTRRLYLYNRSNHTVRISSIYVAGGEGSRFKLIADGVRAQRHDDVELASGDSLYLFFQFSGEVTANADFLDFLRVETADRVDEVPLFAHVLDAYLIRDSILDCNTVLPIGKPIVVDGIMRVDAGCTVLIPAGARLFFTSRQQADFSFDSQIQVLGRLIVEGTSENPVLMTNFRLGSSFSIDWQETAGQWGGLHFTQFSQGSLVQHTLIRNANIAVRVDSISLAPPEPKVILSQVEIRNSSNFGILCLGASSAPGDTPALLAENVLAYNAGQSVVGIFFGGTYQFTNCTFADYNQVRNSGNQPAVAISNYLSFENEQGIPQAFDYPTNVQFANCIIWGSQEEEFGTDFRNFGGTVPVLGFQHTLLKAKPFDTGTHTNQFNQDPLFENPFERKYKLRQGSPAIGTANATLAPFVDLLGRVRNPAPSKGAIEFFAD